MGFDAHKQREGIKRQIAVDTQGWLLSVLVHRAHEQDKLAGRWLLQRLPCFSRLALFVFDKGYASDALLHWCEQVFSVRTQVTQRTVPRGFQVQPLRWIVERTFGWLNRFRRLSKDYEQSPGMAESYIYLTMVDLMLRRFAP